MDKTLAKPVYGIGIDTGGAYIDAAFSTRA
jgi:hypothetical protein